MIYQLDNFLTDEECDTYIESINNTTNNVPFTDHGHFTNNKWTDELLAQKLYNRLVTYGINDNILRPNKLMMSGKYDVGDCFCLHTDTGLYYNKQANEETRWTLLIYLNDDFVGGETIFYDDEWNETNTIIPVRRKALLFDIDIWHKANEIISGSKYWIGCEIIGNIVRKN